MARYHQDNPEVYLTTRLASDAFTLLNDLPLGDGQRDLLGAGETADRLAELVLSSRSSAPFTLAIDAGWGMGKSSLMRELRHRLDNEKTVHTVWFNAWTAEGVSALEGLIKSVLGRLDGSTVRRMLRQAEYRRHLLGSLRVVLLLGMSVLHLSRVVDEIWERLSIDGRSRNEMRNLVQGALRDWTERREATADARLLVVFIDDMDRCTDRNIIEICEATKLYLDVPGIVFVIGCDQNVLAQSVHRARVDTESATGRNYLEKIVQVIYPIPAPSDEQVRGLVDGYAQQSRITSLVDDAVKTLLAERTERNPRRIKRLINSFVLEYLLDREWEELGAESLIKVILLRHFYAMFYRLLTQPATQDPIAEFLDYHQARNTLRTGAQDQSRWITTGRAFESHGLAPPSADEHSAGLEEYLKRLEQELPVFFPDLARDTEFVSLLTNLGNEKERARLTSKLLRKPLMATVTDFVGPGARDRRPGNVEESLRSLNVLWIDDEPEGNRALTNYLENCGAHVLTVKNLAEVTDALRRFAPNVIVSDITRGNDSNAGFRDLEELRSSRAYNGPVVFYTGRVTPTRVVRAKELDAIDVTASPETLLDVLASVGIRGNEHSTARSTTAFG